MRAAAEADSVFELLSPSEFDVFYLHHSITEESLGIVSPPRSSSSSSSNSLACGLSPSKHDLVISME
jgi:hypothetical protein